MLLGVLLPKLLDTESALIIASRPRDIDVNAPELAHLQNKDVAEDLNEHRSTVGAGYKPPKTIIFYWRSEISPMVSNFLESGNSCKKYPRLVGARDNHPLVRVCYAVCT